MSTALRAGSSAGTFRAMGLLGVYAWASLNNTRNQDFSAQGEDRYLLMRERGDRRRGDPCKAIGLGLNKDLWRHGGMAITYQHGGWQKAGLTNIPWDQANHSLDKFKESFVQAATNADVIRFDVTSWNPDHSRPGVTLYEMQTIVGNSTLFQKTIFISNGSVVRLQQ